MRLEIVVPDNMSDHVISKLTLLTQRLTEHPELVEGLEVRDSIPPPNYRMIMDRAHANSGRFKNKHEVDAYITSIR